MAAEFSTEIVDAISAVTLEQGLNTTSFDEEAGRFRITFCANNALRIEEKANRRFYWSARSLQGRIVAFPATHFPAVCGIMAPSGETYRFSNLLTNMSKEEASTMTEKYAREFADTIMAYLNDNGWKSTFNEENGTIRLDFLLDCTIGHISLLLDLYDNFFRVDGCVDVRAPEANRKEVAEYITRVNYGLLYGNFDLDMSDGEISYKYAVDCDGVTLSMQMVEKAVSIPIMMFKRYGDEMLKVMLGIESAKKAMKNAEKGMG